MKVRNLSRVWNRATLLLMSLVAYGCSSLDTEEPSVTTSAQQELTVVKGKKAVSFAYASFAQLPAGVAGDDTVVFVGSPLEGRVIVLDRFSRNVIGNLPPPPEGFVLPYILRSLDNHRIAVLDAGGLPSPLPLVPANPRIYEYEYHYGKTGFVAQLARTISFASVEIGFAEDIAPLGSGRYVLSDAVLGALWVVNADGSISPGIVPKSNKPVDSLFPLSFCPNMPEISVGGIPFLFTAATLPGVAALAAKGERLFFYSPCARGLYSVAISALFDKRPAHERIDSVRLVSSAPAGVAVEQLLGLAFNRYDRDDAYLYAADSLQLRIIRINVINGAREIVAADPVLFNFPSSANFLPPARGSTPLLVVSNQQHRLTLTNDAISEDMLQPPFLATEVMVR